MLHFVRILKNDSHYLAIPSSLYHSRIMPSLELFTVHVQGSLACVDISGWRLQNLGNESFTSSLSERFHAAVYLLLYLPLQKKYNSWGYSQIRWFYTYVLGQSSFPCSVLELISSLLRNSSRAFGNPPRTVRIRFLWFPPSLLFTWNA